MMTRKNLISFVALFIFVVLAFGSTNSSQKNASDADTSMAKVMCDSFMEKRLKAPGSAEFAGPFDGVKANHLGFENGIHTYEMVSYVDAQNSFGAKLRTKFYCKISNVPGSDSWSLIDLKTL